MKNTLLLLITFISLSLKAQYTLESHPMYSDVWVMVNKDDVNALTPKYGKFNLNTSKIKNNIDIDEVKTLLLESYNQFRKDYGLNSVTIEDKKMSEESSQYSKTLNGSLTHSNSNNQYNECLAYIPFMLITNVETDNVNLNKVIADCYFDIFVGCPAHMAILLKEDITTAGFGINITDTGIQVCIRNK